LNKRAGDAFPLVKRPLFIDSGKGASCSSLQGGNQIVKMKDLSPYPHSIYRVVSFKIISPYMIRVGFDDQTAQVIDFQPILAGELYRPLRDLSLFNQVRIDPEVHTLVWPNGADFDPATLHDWPKQSGAWKERARQWEMALV